MAHVIGLFPAAVNTPLEALRERGYDDRLEILDAYESRQYAVNTEGEAHAALNPTETAHQPFEGVPLSSDEAQFYRDRLQEGVKIIKVTAKDEDAEALAAFMDEAGAEHTAVY